MNRFTCPVFLSFIMLAACAPPKIASLPDTNADTSQTAALPGASLQKASNTTLKTIPNAAAALPSSWELRGAMAARSKNKSWTASINWLQRGAGAYQIRLSGPLGSGAILIEKQGGTVTYRDGPKSATSSNADALLKQQTGVRLPVNHLYYWVRGIAAPGAIHSEKRDGGNHLTVLRQAGFTIEYLAYKNVGNMILPSQIRLQGNGVFIKLVIKNWNT